MSRPVIKARFAACVFALIAADIARAEPIAPAFSSLPAAPVKIYLDFVGDDTPSWGVVGGALSTTQYHPGITPAYDIDNDPSTFNATELDVIHKVWQRVAEKYSPFNINVTTVDPGNINNLETMRVVIGGDSTWLNQPAGGVAMVDSFSSTHPLMGDNIVFVFPSGSANDRLIGENAAHEAGHSFGLQHQSTYNASNVRIEQYNTNGNSAEKAPIMGLSRNANRGLWWNGTSEIRNPFNGNLPIVQDDLAVITRSINGIAYRADDHPNTAAAAEPMQEANNQVSASGIIETTADVDFFSFTTPGGTVNLNLTPPYGGMLDAKLDLFDDLGTLLMEVDHLAGSTAASLEEQIFTDVSPGLYRVAVSSHGLYGDIGSYSLSGTVVPEPSTCGAVIAVAAMMLGRKRSR